MRLARSRPLRLAALSCAIAAIAATAWAQDGRVIRIIPDTPAVGAAFIVEAYLPGERADSIDPMEPGVAGPARYTGADVRPAEGGSVIAYRFIATGAGRVDIADLTARSARRFLHLGSWSVETESDTTAPARRSGSWDAPRSVMAREVFRIAALGPDGEAEACPSFAVEGVLLEPVPDSPGAFYAVALEAGTPRLPGLEIGATNSVTLAPRSIEARPLPPAAQAARAVGGPWRLELVAPRSSASVGAGEVVAWDIRAVGEGWPGLAPPPELIIEAPDGTVLPAGGGTAYSSGSPASGVVAGARGAFTVSGPGTYLVRPVPYPWFDTAAGVVRGATAPAVALVVAERADAAWRAPEDVADFARRELSTLAGADARWEPVLAAVTTGGSPDWPAIRLDALRAAGVGADRGALAGARVSGPAARDKVAALAALGLLASGRDAGLRAEAYSVFLRLERAAFPLGGVSGMADAAAASFGNLARESCVLPPFGWLAALTACLIAVACRAFVALRKRSSGAALGGRAVRVGAVVSLALGALSLTASIASAVERSGPLFVSLGGQARQVPSALGTSGPAIEAGRTGRVLRSAGPWLFVELDDGRAVWLDAADIAWY